MGLTASKPAARLPVPAGMTRLCVSGFGISHHTGRARKIAATIAETYPDRYETWFYFDSRGFRPEFLESIKAELPQDQQEKFKSHQTSPFCWVETPGSNDGGGGNKNKLFAIGGRDKFCEYVQENFSKDDEKNEAILSLCREEPKLKDAFFDNSTPGTAATTSG